MGFSIIAAIGKKRELGLSGDLCFHLRGDMKYFKETTMGRKVLMGRKTWESLPGKLKGRENIVLTRGNLGVGAPSGHAPGRFGQVFISPEVDQRQDSPDLVVSDLQAFVEQNRDSEEEIFVIGGGMLYWEMMKYASKLYITEIDAEAEADTFFPEIRPEDWTREVVREGEENGVKFTFAVYNRK